MVVTLDDLGHLEVCEAAVVLVCRARHDRYSFWSKTNCVSKLVLGSATKTILNGENRNSLQSLIQAQNAMRASTCC